MNADYSLLMPFWIDTDGYTDRDREMFVCGVEFEMARQRFATGEAFAMPVHNENASRFRMMAGKLGRRVTITPSKVRGWCEMEAEAAP